VSLDFKGLEFSKHVFVSADVWSDLFGWWHSKHGNTRQV